MKRRDLLKLGALAGASLLTGCSTAAAVRSGPASAGRVVVVGGGPGGISAAQNIKKANPNIEVTLVEKNADYSTCFGSNWVLGGIVGIDDITFNYKTLQQKHGINVVHDEVIGVDPDKQLVRLAMASKPLAYDRLVVSPGISFKWDTIEGLDESTAYQVPHAWKAGYQTLILKSQLQAMPDNGVMVMAAPPNPFRCPPGPYERASMIATFMKAHKPKAKLIILDSKDKFSKQGMFTAGWEEYYGYGSDDAMIEWVSKSNGGEVTRVDPKTKEVVTANGQTIKADVVNFIPSQTANTTAKRMGLTDASGWCPVNQETFESTLVPNIHVLGDASVASPMPKSGFSANSQGMVCGAAVAALLAGHQPNANATMGNQCYSLVTPDYGISVAAGYKLEQSKIVKTSGGLFPKDGSFAKEARSAHGWYAGITGSLFK